MVSQLDSAIKKQAAAAFKGQLITCTLRRVGATSVNSYGDPVPGAASTWTFDGIRDNFRAEFAAAAGIPVTDVKILVIRGSGTLATALPLQQDDQVKVRDKWYQLRRKMAQDPADASEEWAGFEIADPTA